MAAKHIPQNERRTKPQPDRRAVGAVAIARAIGPSDNGDAMRGGLRPWFRAR